MLVTTGDVCSRDDVRRAIDLGHTQFGALHGVIHAAGVIEDGVLLVKSPESAARVLDPKVKGTLVLDSVLRDVTNGPNQTEPLDFLALFSSVSSVLAPAGQVDYTAANAFLDALAESQNSTRVVAINWGPWRDVGMAARLSSSHPLISRRLIDTADEIACSTSLSCQKHWVLAEHRDTAGKAVFPGTGYLEMASAALSHGSFDRGVEFEDVFFALRLLRVVGRPEQCGWTCTGPRTEPFGSRSAHATRNGSSTPPDTLHDVNSLHPGTVLLIRSLRGANHAC